MRFKKSLFIGINYKDHEQGRLHGCINDCRRWFNYANSKHTLEQTEVLIDEPDEQFVKEVTTEYRSPTKSNILDGFEWVRSGLEAGDNILVTYSGHGSYMVDKSGDEDDGYDETMCPVDYDTAGDISDDRIREELINKVPAGVTVYCIFDCCHSGTVLDLPRVLKIESPPQIQYSQTPQLSVYSQPQYQAPVYSPPPVNPIQQCSHTGRWYYLDPVKGWIRIRNPYRSSRSIRKTLSFLTKFFKGFHQGLNVIQEALTGVNEVYDSYQQTQQMFSQFHQRRTVSGAEARRVLRTKSKSTYRGVTTEELEYPVPKARVICISGCRDDQTSADAREETNEGVLAVGACSNALLSVLESRKTFELTVGDVLSRTRNSLSGKYEQVVQITTSGFTSSDVFEF